MTKFALKLRHEKNYEVSITGSIWQILNVCDKTFDISFIVCRLFEPFFDFREKSWHDFSQSFVIQDEILAFFSDLKVEKKKKN